MVSVINALSSGLASLTELLLPRACLGCGQYGTHWCGACFAAEFRPALHRPDPCPAGLAELAAAGEYAATMRAAVLAAKERDRRELDPPLGAALAGAVGLLVTGGPVWLVPVPASPAARRVRGRDHVADWAARAVGCLRSADIPACCVPALRRRPGGRDSVGLDAGQRAANLSAAFAVRAPATPPPGTVVVIVDDIVTTGATLAAASACLGAAFSGGDGRIQAAVVAATQRR